MNRKPFPILFLVSFVLSFAACMHAGKPSSHSPAPITVTGPTVATPILANAPVPVGVTLTFPPVPGNASDAVLSIAMVADATASGGFVVPIVNNQSGAGSDLYFAGTTHAEGVTVWTYRQKQDVRALQAGSVFVTFALYAPDGQTVTATLTPTATFSIK